MTHTNTHDPAPSDPNDKAEAPRASAWLLTTDQAASQLSLSRSSIYALLNSGELPSLRFGVARRIPQAAVLDLIERKLRESQITEDASSAVGLAMRRPCDSWELPTSRRLASNEGGRA